MTTYITNNLIGKFWNKANLDIQMLHHLFQQNNYLEAFLRNADLGEYDIDRYFETVVQLDSVSQEDFFVAVEIFFNFFAEEEFDGEEIDSFNFNIIRVMIR